MTRLIYIFLVSIAAFTLFVLLLNPQKYWLVCTALLLSFIFIGNTFYKRLTILLLTGLVSAVCVFVAGESNHYLPIALGYLCLITAVLQLFAQRFPTYRMPAILINIFVIIAASSSISPAENLSRSIFIMYGTSIVMLVQCLFLYHFKQTTLTSWLIITLRQLQWLSSEIFACYTDAAYPDNLYLFERRIHLQKIKVIQSLNHLRNTAAGFRKASAIQQKVTKQLQLLTQIYHLLLSLAMLRWRVTDFTIFRVCQNEMQNITQAVEHIFISLMAKFRNSNIQVETYPLAQAIIRLEENYQQVLHVTAREPLVFLLFINDLKALNSDLHDFLA